MPRECKVIHDTFDRFLPASCRRGPIGGEEVNSTKARRLNKCTLSSINQLFIKLGQ